MLLELESVVWGGDAAEDDDGDDGSIRSVGRRTWRTDIKSPSVLPNFLPQEFLKHQRLSIVDSVTRLSESECKCHQEDFSCPEERVKQKIES